VVEISRGGWRLLEAVVKEGCRCIAIFYGGSEEDNVIYRAGGCRKKPRNFGDSITYRK
jgi:hypothetical protein